MPVAALGDADNFDTDSFRLVADLWASDTDVYRYTSDAERHPYFPLQIYLIVVADKVADLTGMSFNLLLRVAPLIADLVLIGLLTRATPEKRLALGYAVNPLSALIIGIGAQFDAIPLTLAFIATLLRFGPRDARMSLGVSAVVLGLAVAEKTWPILLLLVLAYRRDDLKGSILYCALVFTVPIAAVFLYSLQWARRWNCCFEGRWSMRAWATFTE